MTSPLMTFITDALLKYPQRSTDSIAAAQDPTVIFERRVALNSLLLVLRGDAVLWPEIVRYVQQQCASPTTPGGSAFLSPEEK